MKKAKDIASDAYNMDRDEDGNNIFYEWNVIEAIKEAQQDAIEATLTLAAEKAMMIRSVDGSDDDLISLHEIIAYDVYYKDGGVAIDGNSILSLKDELFKQVE